MSYSYDRRASWDLLLHEPRLGKWGSPVNEYIKTDWGKVVRIGKMRFPGKDFTYYAFELSDGRIGIAKGSSMASFYSAWAKKETKGVPSPKPVGDEPLYLWAPKRKPGYFVEVYADPYGKLIHGE